MLDLHPQAAECLDPKEQCTREKPKTLDDNDWNQEEDEDPEEEEEQYPLHSALANGHTWNHGIQPLVENFVEALVIPHAQSGLYPYQMAASFTDNNSQQQLDTIYGLLRAQPGVLQSHATQEEDLGLLVLAMQEQVGVTLSEQEKSEVLMYLTSDDEESFSGMEQRPDDGDEDAKVRAMYDYEYKNHQSLDGSNHSKDSTDSGDAHRQRPKRRKRRAGRRRSFVSFDDQAQILQQAAEVYQKRKENGFRDLGLMEHIDNCKETRAGLRHIGDPEVLRKKKIADFIEEFRRTKPRGKQTHGLSEYEVKERLAVMGTATDKIDHAVANVKYIDDQMIHHLLTNNRFAFPAAYLVKIIVILPIWMSRYFEKSLYF